MRNNLIVYESHYGTTKKAAEALALVLGNSKTVDVGSAQCDIEAYESIVFAFCFYGYNTASGIKKYIKEVKETLQCKKIAVIGVGLAESDMDNYIRYIEEAMGRKADIAQFIPGEMRITILTDEDKALLQEFYKKIGMTLSDRGNYEVKNAIEAGENIKEVIDKPVNKLNDEILKKEIDKFINSHNTCALATGADGYVRNTPIEYIYYQGYFYFITEGGFKFKGILQNPNVSIAIFNDYTGMNKLKGLQVAGKAEIVPIGYNEYEDVMKKKGLKIDYIKKMPITMNMIKVTPERFEFLNSRFKEYKVDTKQCYHVI